ncbi:MAG: amino acid hydroxylase [Chloroflexota bacterium]|nr:amino acid hydroxylase [Chloroflexota bacterium]
MRPFKQFDAADSVIWSTLYTRQWANAERHAVRLWLDGVRALDLKSDRIPDFAILSDRIHDLTGWRLVSTEVQYSSGQDWFEALARKEFLITEYIRDADVLDYTPLPDIFHDVFGHLPFLADQRYADYLHRFAQTAIQYTTDERKSLGSLWWYTVEFGLLRERGELKALGAGLLSSVAELQRAYSDAVTRRPYTLSAFESLAPSPHNFHETLFVLESFEQVEDALIEWADAHPAERVGV